MYAKTFGKKNIFSGIQKKKSMVPLTNKVGQTCKTEHLQENNSLKKLETIVETSNKKCTATILLFHNLEL